MTVANGVNVLWPTTAATIPANWARNDQCAGKYLRGAANGADSGSTGGALTHTHTDAGHQHGIPAHTHSSGSLQDGTTLALQNVGSGTAANHNHSLPATSADAGSDTVASSTATFSTLSSEPPNLTAIMIQSNGSPAGLPQYALAYWASATLPTGWSRHPATLGSYVKVAALAADGGATAGSAAHTHVGSGHTHGASAGHIHALVGPSGAAAVGASADSGAGGTVASQAAHTHTVSGNTATQTTGANASAALSTGLASTDPPFVALVHIQNSVGSNNLPLNVICIWPSTVSTIPTGWVLCNGSNGTPDLRTNFVKGSSLAGQSDVLTTGGSQGHSHGAGGHTHVVTTHTHTGTSDSATIGTIAAQTGGGTFDIGGAHTHPILTGAESPTPLTSASANATAGTTADTRPPFYDVLYIQYQTVNAVTITSCTCP